MALWLDVHSRHFQDDNQSGKVWNSIRKHELGIYQEPCRYVFWKYGCESRPQMTPVTLTRLWPGRVADNAHKHHRVTRLLKDRITHSKLLTAIVVVGPRFGFCEGNLPMQSSGTAGFDIDDAISRLKHFEQARLGRSRIPSPSIHFPLRG